jgi:basic amino acid/polyamine antiporter, APA family
LAYYAVANASASTLTAAENRPARWIPILGLAGCITLAITLPLTSVLAGAGVLIIGAVVWLIRHSKSSGQEA